MNKVFEAESYLGSSFTVDLQDSFLAIYDRNLGRTVTNDAHKVIERIKSDLAKSGLDINDFKIVYQDSMGVWDAMKVRNGTFSGFIGLGADSFEQAIEKYDALKQIQS